MFSKKNNVPCQEWGKWPEQEVAKGKLHPKLK